MADRLAELNKQLQAIPLKGADGRPVPNMHLIDTARLVGNRLATDPVKDIPQAESKLKTFSKGLGERHEAVTLLQQMIQAARATPGATGGGGYPMAKAEKRAPQPAVRASAPPPAGDAPVRLVSLDAYRGFVMLLMASSGLSIWRVFEKYPDVLTQFDGTAFAAAWKGACQTLVRQLEHVEWTGCTLWDLIQPSFMFIVGVAMPFSYARRRAQGDSAVWRFVHVLWRSLVLVALGIFLRSRGSAMTNFTFEDVLTQIGLGYPIVSLFVGRRAWLQMLGLTAILAGSWWMFYQYTPPQTELENVTKYLSEVKNEPESEWTQFQGLASHWNKHTNAAAAFDRWFMNLFPRPEEEWNGRKFWVNGGGYQTLNFVPSMATMLLGVMAGQLLMGAATGRQKVLRLLLAGLVCLAAGLMLDTHIWPVSIGGADWSLAPIVKRIWTPSWALFSGGWALVLLAAFYWVIDLRGWRRWAFPFVVVGMNSIVMYCMAQLLPGWISQMLKIHLAAVDAATGFNLTRYLFSEEFHYALILESVARLAVMWAVCWWLYRRRVFIRI